MKTNLKLIAGISLTAFSISPCVAVVLISDDFTGSSSDPLNGQTATVSTSITAAGGSDTWSAGTSFYADGSVPGTVGDDSSSAALSVGSYINDAKGTAEGIFTLTSTISQVTGGGSDSWVGMGFFTGTYYSSHPIYKDNLGVGAVIRRAGTGDTFFDYTPGGTGTVTTDWSTVTTDVAFTVVLDLTNWNGTSDFGSLEFYMDGSSTPDAVANLTSDYDFSYVGLSSNLSSTGSIESFSLVQIPEPSFVPLVLLSGLAVLIRRRR
jgi:hypothetical protein